MEEYKSWHEEDGITFHNQMNIFFSQCDKFKRLSLHELLKITSDTAVEEYRQRGLSRDVLTQNRYAILVSRVSFKINRMPAENEHITITTWEEKPEALQF
ncbi:MAG: acyl-[acyl-carrier-protein] thioesterase, partial [Treponema sp.]|nr:acyl-[acyl-carrier-protein] thioesterase [Treponema sp.]